MSGSGGSAWPTANAGPQNDTDQNWQKRREVCKERHGGNGFGLTLGMAATAWPTPMAGTPAQNGNSAAGSSDFSRKAEELARAMWTTPQAHDVRMRGAGQTSGATGSNAGNRCLATDAVLWGTPRASDAEKGGPNMAFGAGGTPLPAQAAQWPTPAAQNVKGSGPDSVTRADGKSRMDILHYRAEQGFSRPDQETPRHGPTLSQLRRIWRPLRASLIASHGRATWRRLWKARAKRRLNPIFVGWLMGWPIGHALCACSATEFSQWQQRMRGALSLLPTASGPWIWTPPAETAKAQQMTLL